jgi:hypothetical protein
MEADMTEPATPEQFVGTWRLVTMRADRGDGAPGEPYGPQPLGYITYTADGHMHAILMDPDRRRVGTSIEEFGQHHGLRRVALLVAKLPALARLTEAAAKAMAYSATWEIRGAEVVHHVTASVLPDAIGTNLVRTYAFDADRMTLTAHYPDGGSVELVWQKA